MSERHAVRDDLAFTLGATPAGLAATLIVDGAEVPLVLSRTTLTRAIALRRIPVGDERLALSFGLLDLENRVLCAWGFVRRGDDIELIEERGGASRGWRAWADRVEEAWGEAVDGWMA